MFHHQKMGKFSLLCKRGGRRVAKQVRGVGENKETGEDEQDQAAKKVEIEWKEEKEKEE